MVGEVSLTGDRQGTMLLPDNHREPGSSCWAVPAAGSTSTARWTVEGLPLPFVPYDVSRFPEPQDGLMPYRDYHDRSLEKYVDAIPAAIIPVERARATYILVAGGDDQLWPSERFAAEMAERLVKAGSLARRLGTSFDP